MLNFKKLFIVHKDIIPYLFFGICTTLINLIVYYTTAHLLHIDVMSSTTLAWILAVLFAYFTNRKWVFKSNAKEFRQILKESISFFACRLASGIIDWLCMFIFVVYLNWNDNLIKIIANCLVIISNYLASKLIIFKNEGALDNESIIEG